MYDPFAPPPAVPQMMPGPVPFGQPPVNTQFPLNPGMGGPIQGQQVPAPATPPGQTMTPGGGGTGAPPQGPFSQNNALGGMMGRFAAAFPQMGAWPGAQGWPAAMQGWRQALMDWRGQRPDRQTFAPIDGGAQNWQGALQDWRSQRPTRQSYMSGATPTGAVSTNPNPGV